MTTKPLSRKSAHSPFVRKRVPMDRTIKHSSAFNEEYYTDKNYNYAEWHQDQSWKIVTRLFAHMHPKPDWVFLDIGCALGGMVEALRRHGFESYGIDISRYCLRNSPVKKYLRFGSVTNLPCADQSVDVSICIDTLQYLTQDEVRKAAKELRRVTRKYLCLECITWEDEKFSDPTENPDTMRKHTSLFTRDELIELFENAGFTLKKRRFLPRTIVGSIIANDEYYDYQFSFNAIFEVER